MKKIFFILAIPMLLSSCSGNSKNGYSSSKYYPIQSDNSIIITAGEYYYGGYIQFKGNEMKYYLGTRQIITYLFKVESSMLLHSNVYNNVYLDSNGNPMSSSTYSLDDAIENKSEITYCLFAQIDSSKIIQVDSDIYGKTRNWVTLEYAKKVKMKII